MLFFSCAFSCGFRKLFRSVNIGIWRTIIYTGRGGAVFFLSFLFLFLFLACWRGFIYDNYFSVLGFYYTYVLQWQWGGRIQCGFFLFFFFTALDLKA